MGKNDKWWLPKQSKITFQHLLAATQKISSNLENGKEGSLLTYMNCYISCWKMNELERHCP